jgi:hypothetical protein
MKASARRPGGPVAAAVGPARPEIRIRVAVRDLFVPPA